jgi:hypothetical protein
MEEAEFGRIEVERLSPQSFPASLAELPAHSGNNSSADSITRSSGAALMGTAGRRNRLPCIPSIFGRRRRFRLRLLTKSPEHLTIGR